MRNFIIFVVLVSLFELYSCDSIASKAVRNLGKSGAKELMQEGAEKSTKKIAKEFVGEGIEKSTKGIAKEGIERVVTKSLREAMTSDAALKNLYEEMSQRISKEFADGIVVKTTKEGMELASKDFPNSIIKVNKNLVSGNAGSLTKSGPVNEFLNYLMPNKTYIVDEVFVYKTDDLGRVISCNADRTKAYKVLSGQRSPQRNTNVQKMVVDKLDGRVGDDAGHLFANTTGGPNELINQVPMDQILNRNGIWRELERIEEQALKEGKQVISQRKLLYKGNEKRPYAIEFSCKIDGKETKKIVENMAEN